MSNLTREEIVKKMTTGEERWRPVAMFEPVADGVITVHFRAGIDPERLEGSFDYIREQVANNG